MESVFCDSPGIPIEPNDLKLRMAKALAKALKDDRIDYASFVQARVFESSELVIFDVEVERPQMPVHPIQAIERIEVHFEKDVDKGPLVFSSRNDFPFVPHLNLMESELPRCLCLYDRPFRDLKSRWTPARFVKRIREWFALTAKGALHQPDQPLEPILMDIDGLLFMPPDAFTAQRSQKPLVIVPLKQQKGQEEKGHVLSVLFECATQTHGVIHHRPKKLSDLVALLQKTGSDLLSHLRKQLIAIHEQHKDQSGIVLIVLFPKKRSDDGPVETTETWAFQLRRRRPDGETEPAPIGSIGEEIGIWTILDGEVAQHLQVDETKVGNEILLDVLNPVFGMTQGGLAMLNGLGIETTPNLFAVGVGALGSQVVLNLARAGFGKWTLIDDDRLLPHNLARHYLPGCFVGDFKSPAIAAFANSLTDDKDHFSAIPSNLLLSDEYDEQKKLAMSDADVIVDMSASVTVARYLALSHESSARRLSLFLSPSGQDLVLLAEDSERRITLDQIEMQYYRANCGNDDLQEHMKPSSGQHRYGQTCRDLTSTLPQHLVALHSAIGADALRRAINDDKSQAFVWRASDDGGVKRVEVPIAEAVRIESDQWRVITDRSFLSGVKELRHKKLPNETGGILLGSIDVNRQIVYIVDTIPSPPDSEEWPTLFIRGRTGLKAEVDRITDQTDGMLEYIGEWHSHPDGVPPNPSRADHQVFAWIAEIMDCEGLPAVMMIVGENETVNCFVGEMVALRIPSGEKP